MQKRLAAIMGQDGFTLLKELSASINANIFALIKMMFLDICQMGTLKHINRAEKSKQNKDKRIPSKWNSNRKGTFT